jgi:hypothetical protein
MRALALFDNLPKRSACKAVQAAIGMDAASAKLSDDGFNETAVLSPRNG